MRVEKQTGNQGLVIRLTGTAASVYGYRQVLLFRSRITPWWMKRTLTALPAICLRSASVTPAAQQAAGARS